MGSLSKIQAPVEKKVILAFRLQSVLVILAILALGGGEVFLTTTAFKIAALYLASNALLTLLPGRYFQTKALIGAIVVVDVLFVSLCIHFSENSANDIYLLYFLAIFMAALSRDLRTTVVAAVVISAVYLWVSFSTIGLSNILTSGFLLRIPLFFVTAFFAGFLANQARQREVQHREAKRIAAHLEEQLEKERKREKEVANRYRDLSKQHQELISSINTGVIVVDNNAVIVTFNPEAQRLTGLKANDVLGHSIADFQELAPLSADIRDSLMSSSAHACMESEHVFRLEDGQVVTVGVSTSPILGEKNVTAAVIVAMRDLTELDRLRERIRQLERLACLGGTALCMVREIHNQLKPIMSIARVQCERTDPSDRFHQSGEAILIEAENIDSTVLQTVQFIRREASPFETLDLNEVVGSCVSGLERELERSSISVTLDLDPFLPCVLGNALQLSQVIIQVLVNAMEAVEENGGIRISTRTEDGRVVCDIQDDGPGVPDKMRHSLFEPLSSTKKDGTGMGLFISQRIIDEHGGSIELLEGSAKGAAFEIKLPARMSEQPSMGPSPSGKKDRDQAAA